VRIGANQFEGDATTDVALKVNLPATATADGAAPVVYDMPFEYFGNLGQPENMTIQFTPQAPAAPGDPNTNTWRMQITDDALGGATVADFEVVFSDTRDHGGTIDSVTPWDPLAPIGSYNAVTGDIEVIAQSGPIQINIGRRNEAAGLSQLSDTYISSVTKNGSPVGNLASVEIDEKGILYAIYDTGFTKAVYQIPVVDVPDLNGLRPLPNQSYQVSSDSGAFYLWDAGDGPVGDMVGFSREESATDVASELTQLIQTQRAYNSNAKVIQTVDEMLQETTNIKR
jgi:flagellar hook protein FlgE